MFFHIWPLYEKNDKISLTQSLENVYFQNNLYPDKGLVSTSYGLWHNFTANLFPYQNWCQQKKKCQMGNETLLKSFFILKLLLWFQIYQFLKSNSSI